jgi:hypothetical protein
MKQFLALTFTLIVIGIAPRHLGAAEKIEPRLATVRKAWVEPADELADYDRSIAACLSDSAGEGEGHLAKSTPIVVVKTKDEADVIFRIGSTSSDATITAYLPDGTTKLWAGDTPMKAGFGIYKVHRDACGLSEKLIDALRQAMRKARDAKK